MISHRDAFSPTSQFGVLPGSEGGKCMSPYRSLWLECTESMVDPTLTRRRMSARVSASTYRHNN